MIIFKNHVSADQGPDSRTEALGAFTLLRLSDAGGLTQFGAYAETLQPGSRSSDRHWHEKEDEFLYMLSGEAVVIENDGEHVIGPGDACCWPAGIANAHHVLNRSGNPCTYLIVGTRPSTDTVHYPDIGRIQYDEEDTWRVCSVDGTVIRHGRK